VEQLRGKSAGQEVALRSMHAQLRECKAVDRKVESCEVLDALPPLPKAAVTVSSSVMSPKLRQTPVQCMLCLVHRLKQEPLTPQAQKVVETLIAAAQVRTCACICSPECGRSGMQGVVFCSGLDPILAATVKNRGI
jgi:hypothetical protein